MIVNPDKFKAIIFTKSKQDTSGIPISLRGHWIVTQKSSDLLSVTIDCSLSFKKHVSKLCKSSAYQLSALKRLRPDIINEKIFKNLIQSFTLSHFNHCPTCLVLYQFQTAPKYGKDPRKDIEIITDDYVSSYEVLLINAGFTTIRDRKMQNIWIEIYKTVSNLNLQYMRELVEKN